MSRTFTSYLFFFFQLIPRNSSLYTQRIIVCHKNFSRSIFFLIIRKSPSPIKTHTMKTGKGANNDALCWGLIPGCREEEAHVRWCAGWRISSLHVEQRKLTAPSSLWRPVVCFLKFTSLLEIFKMMQRAPSHIVKPCKIPHLLWV